MPEEGEKFGEVDMAWREVMATAALAPAALPLGHDRSALESLQSCNCLLDEIQKGLAAYLEKKRLFFPRCGTPLSMPSANIPVHAQVLVCCSRHVWQIVTELQVNIDCSRHYQSRNVRGIAAVTYAELMKQLDST